MAHRRPENVEGARKAPSTSPPEDKPPAQRRPARRRVIDRLRRNPDQQTR